MNHIDIIKELNNTKDEYLVIGVSSGPDSMALLHMLINNTNKLIVCAHINHNVRTNSDKEEKYLKQYCKDEHIIFESMKIDSYKETNFENEARKKRYDFYEKILKKYHSHTLLLAHHGDDLIETVLMKMIRGSNLEGYAGIKIYSKQKDYTIVRPLLYLTKKDIIVYNKEKNIKYYIDNTNEDTKYTRNRIRKNILPVLKEEDSLIHLKILKYSEELQSYYNYVEEVCQNKIKDNYQNNTINLNIFNSESLFIKKQIIFNLLSNLYDNRANIIKDRHIDSIIKLSNSNKPNAIINLKEDFIARKAYNYIYIEKNNHNCKDYKVEFKDYCKINDIIIKKVSKIDKNSNNVCLLNSNNIKLPLYLRNRKKGDIISLYNMNGTKKIKDVFIDAKIPLNKRDSYPILVDAEDNILWIPNIKKSKYNVKKSENYDIILNSYKESEEQNEEKSY